MQRDFTQQTEEELEGYITQETADWDSLPDAMHYIMDNISYAFGNFKYDADSMDQDGDVSSAYYKAVFDLKDTSQAWLHKTFDDVNTADKDYAKMFDDAADTLGDLVDKLEKATSSLSSKSSWHSPYSGQYDDYKENERQQEKIDDLYNEKRFSQDTWDKASDAEKRKILNEWLKELQRIMGTQVDPHIVFEDSRKQGLPGNDDAHYNPTTNTITVNTDLWDEIKQFRNKTLRDIVHETRHAYQFEVTSGKGHHKVSRHQKQTWAYNQQHYKACADDKSNWGDYASQPTEYDARKFAKQTRETNDIDKWAKSHPGFKYSTWGWIQ
jgi:hypothetical protein